MYKAEGAGEITTLLCFQVLAAAQLCDTARLATAYINQGTL